MQIVLQDLVYKTGMRIELWPMWLRALPITRRLRMHEHLRNRPTINPKAAGDFPLADPMPQDGNPHVPV
jgi:hypothetical protein